VNENTLCNEKDVLKITDAEFEFFKTITNKAVIRALAEYLDKPKTLLTIKSGHTSSAKVIEIL
jgi:hypothetical protein